MKFITTFRLFVAAVILAGVIWFFEWRHAPARGRQPNDTRVLRLMAEDVRQLRIERDTIRVDCVKSGGTWAIERPIRAKADDGLVERIVSALEAMPRREVITAEQCRERELGLKDYGLLDPRVRIVVDDRLGREELLVGDDAPLGALVYVKLAGSDEVIATQRAILDVLPAGIEDLRDRAILHGTAAGTTRLEVQGHGRGFIQATQAGGKWFIQQPIGARADGAVISRMLDALYALKVERFIWDPVVDPPQEKDATVPEMAPGPRTELYDLGRDEAAARVTVWVNGDEVGKELILGKPVSPEGKEVYAKRGDADSVYAVSRDILDAFSLGVNEMRDRLLFPVDPADVRYAVFKEGDRKLALERKADAGWVLVEPAPWKADDHVVDELILRITRLAADSFVVDARTNPGAFGLSPPAYVIQLATEAPGPAAPRSAPEKNGPPPDKAPDAGAGNRLLLAAPADDKPVYAKFDDDPTVFLLASDAVRGVVTQLTEPLVYRDRTMLAVPTESIRRLSLSREGVEEQVVRDDAGVWTASKPATNQVNRDVVQDILFLAAGLRALRIESNNPRTLAACGLDNPPRVLTLGLTGEGGIQKSLLMGFRARTDGIYAMIQGEDVVFILENGLMDRLTRPLTKPGAPP